MKHLLLSLALTGLGIFLFVKVVQEIGGEQIVDALLVFPLWAFLPILLLTFLTMVTSIWRWRVILLTQGVDISFRNLISIWLAAFAFSYATPIVYVGGEMIKGFALKDRWNITWRKTFASISIDNILDGIGWILFSLTGMALFITQTGLPPLTKSLIAGSFIFFIFAVVIAFVFFKSFRKERIVKPFLKRFTLENSQAGQFLSDVETGIFAFFRWRNKRMWEGVAITAFKHFFAWTRNLLLIFFLGKGVAAGAATIALGFSYIAYSAPIPAALGAFEAIESVAFANIGLGAGTGAALTFITRATEIIFLLLGAIFLIRWGIGLFAWSVMRNAGLIKNNNSPEA